MPPGGNSPALLCALQRALNRVREKELDLARRALQDNFDRIRDRRRKAAAEIPDGGHFFLRRLVRSETVSDLGGESVPPRWGAEGRKHHLLEACLERARV